MSGEKTEKPTDKKIKDALEKGQVAVSKDAQIVFKLGSFYLFFFWVASGYSERFSKLMDAITTTGFKQAFFWSPEIISMSLDLLIVITAPLVAVCALSATVITWAQTGFVVAPEAVTPSFKKFDAVGNIKNMFSKKTLIQLLLSVFKVAVLSWVGFLVFKDSMNDVVFSYRVELGNFFIILTEVLKRIIFYSLAIFLLLSVIDWALERANLMKNLRMSHQDIKDEYKQSDGDPQMKQKRKKEHRSILNSALSKVSMSKVVVANPTHISIALDYEPGKHDLPFVVAMGIDEEALLIRQEAKKHGVPVLTNIKLARMIYQDCEQEEYIQKQHLELAAQVFRTVMEMAASPKQD